MNAVASLNRPDVRAWPVYIYGLAGPDDVVRYVGKSDSPHGRIYSQEQRAASGVAP